MTSLPYRSDIVDDTGSREWEVDQMVLGEPVPPDLTTLVPMSQPEPPSLFRVPQVHIQQFGVSRYPKVLVVSMQFLAQFLPLFLYRPVPIVFAPLPHGRHRCS